MNYYERHLGDYARDAGHLSMLEHGAYTLLLDRYYSTEQPIPADQVYRVARAHSAAEKKAVDSVLHEFFVLDNGVWTKGRVQEEIVKAQAKIEAARTNGVKGGRPKQNPTVTQEKPTGLSLGSISVTQQKALQSPISNLQSPNKKEERDRALADARAVVGLDVAAFDQWLEYRRERKPELKTPSLKACAEELAAHGTEQAVVVRHSIANTYQGLFAPKPAPMLNGSRSSTPIKLKTAEEWEAIERERGESHVAN